MMTCIAVDDEPLSLDLLEDNINQVPFLSLVKRCKNAFEAIEVLQNEKIDLIFLDIQMPGLTGIQFLQTLKNGPMVIFSTAYDKYALEGYNLDVVDYLLKPFAFERFLKAVNKAYELHKLKLHETAIQTEIVVKTNEYDFFFVNADYQQIKINIKDVLYAEGLKDYIKIYVAGSSKPVITRLNLKALEEKLPSDSFMRIHKSFLINIKKIETIKKGRVRIGAIEIPVSDFYKENFEKMVGVTEIKFKG